MTMQNPFGMGLDVMRQLGTSQSQIAQTQGERQRQQMLQQQAAEQAALAEQQAMQQQQKDLWALFGNLRKNLPDAQSRIQAIQGSPFAQIQGIEDLMNEQAMSDTGLDQLIAASPFSSQADEFNIGTFNPRDYTPESFAEFTQTRDPRVLKAKQKFDTVTISGTAYRFNPSTGDYDIPVVPGSAPESVDGEQLTIPEQVLLTPEAQAEQAAAAAAEKAAAETRAKEQEKQTATIISEGRAQARTIPTLKQTIELLDQVQTGGWTNRARQWVKQKFGVESADEGVLSANLGKAVLSQLRQTFGAAFTEREGARLAEIEAGFGKSPATNRALLKQVLQLAENDVQNAIDRATEAEDMQTVRELEQMRDMVFDIGSMQDEPVAQQPSYQEGQTATNPSTGERLIFRNGAWQPL